MTQDEITSMAREASCDNYGDCYEFVPETLERFAALVVARERENLQIVRAIALEEAAQLCMDYGREGFSAHVIARAIRGIK